GLRAAPGLRFHVRMRVFEYFAALLTLSLLAASLPAGAQAAEDFVYFGTYTNKGRSQGIYVSRFDTATGKAQEPVLAAEIKSPSWVAVHPNGRFLYAVTEAGRTGSVSAFTIDRATGKLSPLNTVSTKGNGPCHLIVDH